MRNKLEGAKDRRTREEEGTTVPARYHGPELWQRFLNTKRRA